jgi:hypothetical protein
MAARLTPVEWDAIGPTLAELDRVLADGDQATLEHLSASIANLAFRGHVRRRLDADRSRAPAVVPTKPSRALPAVGIVCGGMLLALGWSIGGTVVLVGTALFALFIMGVAVSGTRSFSARRARSAPDPPLTEFTTGVPAGVVTRVDQLRSRLGC